MTARQRDLLQTVVVLGIALTPTWLLPGWLGLPWAAVVAILGGPLLWSTWTHAPFVPTPAADLEYIVAALALRPGERFVDLGAGDGRVLRAVHRATGAEGIGIEAVPGLWLWAWLCSLGTPGVTLRLGDLRRADLSAVDAVYVWGTPYFVGTPSFARWLRRSLPAGARVVSYGQPLHGWAPTATFVEGSRPVFRYVAPPPPAR